MDVLLVMAFTIAAIIAFIYSSVRDGLHFVPTVGSVIACIILTVYLIGLVGRTDPTTPFAWQGTAEAGPLTLLLICAGLSWLVCGGRNDHASRAGD